MRRTVARMLLTWGHVPTHLSTSGITMSLSPANRIPRLRSPPPVRRKLAFCPTLFTGRTLRHRFARNKEFPCMGPALRFLGPHVDEYRRATNTNRLVGQTPVALALLRCIVAQGKPVISTRRNGFAARTAHSHQQLANPTCSWRWWDKCPAPLCTNLPSP